jgi:hypothetical protein
MAGLTRCTRREERRPPSGRRQHPSRSGPLGTIIGRPSRPFTPLLGSKGTTGSCRRRATSLASAVSHHSEDPRESFALQLWTCMLARVTSLNRGGYMILDLGVPRLPVIPAVTVVAGATHSASNDPNRLVNSVLTSFNSPASLSIEFSRPIFLFLTSSLKLMWDILFIIIP